MRMCETVTSVWTGGAGGDRLGRVRVVPLLGVGRDQIGGLRLRLKSGEEVEWSFIEGRVRRVGRLNLIGTEGST